MKKNLLKTIVASTMTLGCTVLITGCDFFGGGDDKINPNLYHLKLSSNLESVSANDLKAIYGYGPESKTVVEGVRDQDEIDELKDAGASDADIEKAGKRQADGSYYFFEGDPMYLESPNSFGGYIYKGFYDKDSDKYIYNQYMTGPEGYISRWNMDDKDVNLEARYEKFTYQYYFNLMDEGDTNPNQEGRYCAIDDGVVTLLPATTTNTHKHFVGWEYQDNTKLDDKGYAAWVRLEDGKLPVEYYEETMRIGAVWEYDSFKISFDFKVYIEPEVFETVAYEDAIVSMSAHGNLTTIDGVKEPCEAQSQGTPITKNSEIKMESGSWLEIFYKLNSKYNLFYFELNGEREEGINASHMDPSYISITSSTEINQDSVITFVLSNAIPE